MELWNRCGQTSRLAVFPPPDPCQGCQCHWVQINGAPRGGNLTSPAAAAVRSVTLSHASSTPLVQKSAVLHPLPDSRGEKHFLAAFGASVRVRPSVRSVAGSDVIPRLNFTLSVSVSASASAFVLFAYLSSFFIPRFFRTMHSGVVSLEVGSLILE